MNILELRGVSVQEGSRVSLRGLDLSLAAGQRLVIFGPSGSGKRALLKTAAGILPPGAGSLTLNASGRPMPVGYVPRDGGLINNLTLLQNVILPVVYHKVLGQEAAEKRGRDILEELGVRRPATMRPSAAPLSARRLAKLARAMLARPALYVLESPLDEMDAESAAMVRGLLKRIAEEKDSATILSTGNLGPYLDWGERFLMVHEDRARYFPDRECLRADRDPEVRIFLS